MRPWLTMSRKHSRSLDDHNPGGELYERHQDPDPKDPPEKKKDPPPDEKHADDDDDDDPEEVDKIDKEKLTKLIKHNKDLRKDRDAMAVNMAKLQKEADARKKADEEAERAKMSDLEKANKDKADLEKRIAESEARAAKAERRALMAAATVDMEYADDIDGKLAEAMKADGFKAKDWFESLKAKKPALFVGEPDKTKEIAGGPGAAGSGKEGVKELQAKLEDVLKHPNSYLDPRASEAGFRIGIAQLQAGAAK